MKYRCPACKQFIKVDGRKLNKKEKKQGFLYGHCEDRRVKLKLIINKSV